MNFRRTGIRKWGKLINRQYSERSTSISAPTRPRVINENVSLCANKFSRLKEIPVFHINDKRTLHPIHYIAVYRTKQITVIVANSEIELWPLALKIAPSIYIEPTEARI